MHAFVLAVALAASPTPVDRARRLATEGAWDELYLAFAAAKPSRYAARERKELGGLLLRGSQALAKDDPVLAFSLAGLADDFHPTPQALLAEATTARAADQRGSAEEAYRAGLRRYPKDAAFPLGLGRLLLEERDHAGAVAALSRIPRGAKEFAQAQPLLGQARAALSQEAEAAQVAQNVERRIYGESAEPAAGARAAPSSGYQSGVGAGGMRTRGNDRFVFRYFNGERDFGQRAEYEGRVASALEDAYTFTREVLGQAREAPVDVVLYTREEFATHHGASLARSVAGFYSDSAIRMNDAAEWTAQTRATLVHEYVHAAVDEFAGGNARAVPRWLNEGLATYVEWRYLGSEDPPLLVARMLQGSALKGTLPHLGGLTDRALIEQSNPTLAYGTAGVAVKLLLKRGGVSNLLALIREVGSGRPFEEALEDRYGRGLARLNEEVAGELKSR